MKKLIITILAMATMALAANKTVCKETEDSTWHLRRFECVSHSTNVKKVTIFIQNRFFSVIKTMNDGSSEMLSVSYSEDVDLTHVDETTWDDLDVTTNESTRLLDGDRFSFFYEQLRDEYDLRRKN